MKISSKGRWLGYALVAILTVGAMLWVDGGSSPGTPDLVSAAPRRPAAASGEAPQDAQLSPRRPQARDFQDYRVNLFSAPTWQRSAAASKAAAAAAAESAAPATPQAPPVPYVYLGRWSENGQSQVYLSAGGLDHRVTVGDTLDGTYRVKSIDDRMLVLEYLPLGVVQTVPLTATASAAAPARTGDNTATQAEDSESN